MTTQTLQKLNSLDLTDGNSVRSLFQKLPDYDQFKNEKDELGKKR